VFNEGRLYAPITTAADGKVTVHLDDDHPGVADPDYRERRNLIAARALRWSPGEPIPRVTYTPEEHGVSQLVSRELGAKHSRLACVECREAMARRLQTRAGRDFFAKVFWFTIEFGVVWEHAELRAYGAGLLSSYGEIDEFRSADIRPLDLAEMATLPYDITRYQPILYAADGLDHLLEVAGSFFAGCDDDSPARLGMAASVRTG